MCIANLVDLLFILNQSIYEMVSTALLVQLCVFTRAHIKSVSNFVSSSLVYKSFVCIYSHSLCIRYEAENRLIFQQNKGER